MPTCALFPFIVWRSVWKAVKLQKEAWCVLFFFSKEQLQNRVKYLPLFLLLPPAVIQFAGETPCRCSAYHVIQICLPKHNWYVILRELDLYTVWVGMSIYFHCLYYSPLPSTSTVRGNRQTSLLSCEVLVTWMYVHVLHLLRTTVIKHCCWPGFLRGGPT